MGVAGAQQAKEVQNFPPCKGQGILLRPPRLFLPHSGRPSPSHPRSTGLDVPRELESLAGVPDCPRDPTERPLLRADLCPDCHVHQRRGGLAGFKFPSCYLPPV